MDTSNTSEGELQPARFDYAEIVVVRHGETEFSGTGNVQEHPEVGLNGKGRLEAAAVAERLSREPKISAVYSSDLRRVLETAEIIATSCGGLEVIKDPALRERHYIKDQEIPGWAESNDQLYRRCTSGLQRIGDKHKGERVVVVTHGAIMRQLHKRVYPRERAERVWSSSVSLLHLFADKWNIKLWGDVSHLKKAAVSE